MWLELTDLTLVVSKQNDLQPALAPWVWLELTDLTLVVSQQNDLQPALAPSPNLQLSLELKDFVDLHHYSYLKESKLLA